LRGIAPGHKSWLFADSVRGGTRAAFMYSLIVTADLSSRLSRHSTTTQSGPMVSFGRRPSLFFEFAHLLGLNPSPAPRFPRLFRPEFAAFPRPVSARQKPRRFPC
jgi:hypothetical protein